MGKDDYAATSGGALKLKGAKNAGVEKKHKKDKKLKTKPVDAITQASSSKEDAPLNQDEELDMKGEEDSESRGLLKTEAERRHMDTLRKRLNDRLNRNGVKTHKERVEELNKYLSTLSEHHDMPRIGPG